MWKQLFANVLQNRCCYKFADIHKKIPVLQSLFNEVTDLQLYWKRDPNTGWCLPVNITKI